MKELKIMGEERILAIFRKEQVAQAQRDDDQKELEATVQGIFEEIGNQYRHTGIRIPQQLKPDTYEYNPKCEHCRLKALKHKYIKEVKDG